MDVNGWLVSVIKSSFWPRIRLAGLEHVALIAADLGGQDEVASLVAILAIRQQ